MRHSYCGGSHRRFAHSDDMADRRHGEHAHHRGMRGGGRRHGRPFDYGELRLVALAMIAEQPLHGYELMKSIGERMGGSYSPSPGVIYPTLAWLEDMGYVAAEPAEQGRKRYRITPEGEAFRAANQAAIDAVMARLQGSEAGGRGVPASVVRAMENLRMAVRLRLQQGALTPEAAQAIAAVLDEAALGIERS